MAKKLPYGREEKQVKCKRWKFSKAFRLRIARRCGFKCHVCGMDMTDCPEKWTMDHVVPLAHGGTNKSDNIKLACRPCNIERGSQITHDVVVARITQLKRRLVGKWS